MCTRHHFSLSKQKILSVYERTCGIVGLFLGFQTMTRKCRFVRLHVIKSRPSERLLKFQGRLDENTTVKIHILVTHSARVKCKIVLKLFMTCMQPRYVSENRF